ncbi:hypothetical protein EVAR_40235_1 [Eumeta japonica]|uniref:Uncharacterized protein n=1 Tax=Eumeta variegata TaxID=151549 RepID=A0A4C1X7T8_EUMVA|nr:hypothetical protein EVAR_40235_1 [Eumeta japonica]
MDFRELTPHTIQYEDSLTPRLFITGTASFFHLPPTRAESLIRPKFQFGFRKKPTEEAVFQLVDAVLHTHPTRTGDRELPLLPKWRNPPYLRALPHPPTDQQKI